jgi:hypothetical protein
MRYLPMRCARSLIVGIQRAIEVDNRRTVSTTALGVRWRPIIDQPDAAPTLLFLRVQCPPGAPVS